MKRENRVNLLFLSVFLAISLPGAVILFRKKLDPNSARMDQPDAMVAKLPYMAPPLGRPGVKWVVPPLTQEWLARLNHESGGRSLLSARAGTWSPVISDDHLMQVVDLAEDSSGAHASIVLWDTAEGPALDPTFSVSTPDGVSDTGRLESVKTITVPEPLKRELMGLSEVQPPPRIVWTRVTFAKWPRGAVVTLTGEYAGGAEKHHSTVALDSNAGRPG